MKGKKCIGLLILCITCLLSLNLSLNANAIRQNVYGVKFNKVDYRTTNPTGTVQDLVLKNAAFMPITYVNIPAETVFDLAWLSPHFTQSYNITKDKKFSYEFNIIVGYKNYAGIGYQLSPIPQAQCPVGWNNYVIDDCSVSIETIDSAMVKLYTQGQVEIPDTDQLLSEAYSFNRWVVKIKGHWNGNNTTVTKFETAGTILSIYNPSTLALQNWDLIYTMSFPTFYFFDEEENAEEEAAQQELEDRDNLESQSTSTDSQANNAGQSAETTGTTLFAAFSQFFNALTNVSGASCVLPNMQVYSLNLGQMDLCTYDIPPQIMALVSIGMVFIIVPLGIHLVKRMLSLYKEITG